MVTIAIFLVSSAGLILARGVYATMVPGTIFAEMDIIQNSGMKNYKKTELDSLEKQLVVLHEEVEKYKDLKNRL